MPVTTRAQEELKNGEDVGSESKNSGKEFTGKEAGEDRSDDEDVDENKKTNQQTGLDDDATYFAVFCSTQVPDKVGHNTIIVL